MIYQKDESLSVIKTKDYEDQGIIEKTFTGV